MSAKSELSDHVVLVGDIRIAHMGVNGDDYEGHGEEVVVVHERPLDRYRWLVRFPDGEEYGIQSHNISEWRLVRRST
jgi:hypothetical protein